MRNDITEKIPTWPYIYLTADEIEELKRFAVKPFPSDIITIPGDSFKKGLEFLGYIPTDSIKGIGNGRVVSIDQIDENLSVPNSTLNLVL